jgi:hypothetical protein
MKSRRNVPDSNDHRGYGDMENEYGAKEGKKASSLARQSQMVRFRTLLSLAANNTRRHTRCRKVAEVI